MSAGALLRAAIASGSGPAQVMAAHSPISARLAEEAGFDGLWASGFELSALYGLPDASLVSMTQHLDMVRAMAGQTTLPIVADIDTGYGNAVNVIHTVREYERAGAAAVVMEDKAFPKMTSLVAGGRQELVRVEEFRGKVEAACAARQDAGFMVIARTEALIAGLGQDEAMARALAYQQAGADMILVHSKQKTRDEIEAFVQAWPGPAPLVLVPTSYPQMTVARVRAFGKVGMMIYGNHAMRAAVAAMQQAFARIVADGGIHNVDGQIATVEEIFRLQGMEALKQAECRYLR